MFNQAKYVVLKSPLADEVPFVFDACVSHDEFFPKGQVISAGFVQFDEDGAHCFGESSSLGVKSRPEEDAHLINWRILRK